ncbi:hypothetical protein [Rhodohalobacter sulfatireducens]|uniref:Peptidase n=1 Tax=Rhodohalobacter sulfatireducens TaxID=2911366 RepID=A0ABS9KDL9_9BACT|nr:hypothetical protein [Rhodohalobacter sulfatireducens]MCG2588956.1 hypothetical protein [Rhodohalobacter sulfatireducens]
MANNHKNNKKSIHYYMRVLHRDIGFLILGLIVIYSISGIVLTFRDTNFLKTERQVEQQLEPNLQANELAETLRMRRFSVESEDAEIIDFGTGTYSKETGLATYSVYQLPVILERFNDLHKTMSSGAASPFTTMLGFLLLFMAVSSFWMFKTTTAQFKRGMIFTAVGIVASIALLIF